MKEIWKLFKEGYTISLKNGGFREINPIYISNLGNIKGRNAIINSDGYLNFSYKSKTYKLHRVIAELFIPNPDRKKCIDHINTIRTDNRVDNLRWCTSKENNNNPLTIKKNNHRKKVLCIDTGKIFQSTKDAENFYKLKENSVCSAANPKHAQQTAGSYHWRYI